ncbi:MAG: response regulator [Candidatus Sericytochromatia bacterium]
MEIKGKILVVDDDSISRIVLEKHLKKRGFEVVSADSAIKGGQILKADNISMVITDVNMPQVSGLEFLLWIKEFKPDCQVILMTGDDTKMVEAFQKRIGKVTFFRKPIDVEKLDSLLESKFMKNKFKNTITDISLIDFIKISVLLNKKKLTQILDPVNNFKGKIYIREGKIIHAEIDDIYGETALSAIAAIKKGSFKEIPWEEPKKQSTINLDTLALIENMENIYNDILAHGNYSPEYETVKKTKILIVEDDITSSTLANRYFSSRGFQVTVASSAFEGMEFVNNEFFHFALVDINMTGMGGMEFFMWLHQSSPRTKVIFMTAFGTDYIKEFIAKTDAINYFEKPLDFKQVEEFLLEFSSEGVEGDLQDIELIDFLQLLALSGDNKFIKVLEPSTGKEGDVFIMAGNVLHAETAELKGEKAFFYILGMETAVFSEEEWMVPPEISINESIGLLLEKSKHSVEYAKAQEDTTPVEEKTSTALVRSVPSYLEKAMYEQQALEAIINETNMAKKLTIYENGVALEIVLGKSTKEDVIKVMKTYSKVSPSDTGQMIIFDDLSVNILFNEAGTAEEINFGNLYIGKTSNGVGIGDTLERAIATYGKPKIGTMKGVVWDNIAFFSQDGKRITSMRMRNKNILEKKEQPPVVETQPIENNLINVIGSVIPTQEVIKNQEELFKFEIPVKEEIKPQEIIIEESVHVEEHKMSPIDIINDLASLPDIKIEEKNQSNNQTDPKLDKFFIDEKDLTVLGIKIGKSTRDDVRIRMHELNYTIGRNKSSARAFYYEDLSLKFGFNERGIVDEIEFGNLYTGKTLKNLGIGNEIKDFIKSYGEPTTKLEHAYIWKGVWCTITANFDDINFVNHIRLQK